MLSFVRGLKFNGSSRSKSIAKNGADSPEPLSILNWYVKFCNGKVMLKWHVKFCKGVLNFCNAVKVCNVHA